MTQTLESLIKKRGRRIGVQKRCDCLAGFGLCHGRESIESLAAIFVAERNIIESRHQVGQSIGGPELPNDVSLSDKDRRSEEHTSELQSRLHLVCRLLLEKKKKIPTPIQRTVVMWRPSSLAPALGICSR